MNIYHWFLLGVVGAVAYFVLYCLIQNAEEDQS